MFNTEAPMDSETWVSAGFKIIPCLEKNPAINGKEWQKKDYTEKDFLNKNIGLFLKDTNDFDVDNHIAKKFIEKNLRSCGAVYGRNSNPKSHYLFKGNVPSKKFSLPKQLEKYCQSFPHGTTLGEIRNASDTKAEVSIVPGSVLSGEKVQWHHYANINEYNGDLEKDISKIMLATALTILYPTTSGARDDFCFATACILADNTKWDSFEIDEFVHDIAVAGKDTDARERMSKGTHARTTKGNKKGLKTIADSVGTDEQTILSLFEWIGCTNKFGVFKGLKCYNTIPKYWELGYKDKWLRIMETASLMSYGKISVLIEENCFETAPEIKPSEWKTIRQSLYKKVEVVDVPFEQSFFGVIAGEFLKFSYRYVKEEKWEMFASGMGVWHNKEKNTVVFRLEEFTNLLRSKRLSFEQRQLTAMLTETFKAHPMKVHHKGKELRCWEAELNAVDKYKNENLDLFIEEHNQKMGQKNGFDKDGKYLFSPKVPF